jgi:excisionase family DNA binding protein
MSKTLYVDRIEASKILKVSTRTVDRYMRSYRIKTKKDGRRVLIKKADIDKIIKDHIGKLVDLDDNNLDNILNKENNEIKGSNLAVKDIKIKKISKEEDERLGIEQQIYKDLYTETKKELRDKQDRLEAATYRVGQLEAQAKNMVPMLDYNKKDRALQEAYAAMDQRSKQSEDIIQKMEVKLRSERIAKWIYLSLVGMLLVAEPILFILWAFA